MGTPENRTSGDRTVHGNVRFGLASTRGAVSRRRQGDAARRRPACGRSGAGKGGLLSLDYRVEPHLSESYSGVMNAAGRAESASARTCEICGRSGSLQDLGGLLATRCDRHAEAMEIMDDVSDRSAFRCVGGKDQNENAPATPSGTPEVRPGPGDEQITPCGSGNVFHDLGLPDPDEEPAERPH